MGSCTAASRTMRMPSIGFAACRCIRYTPPWPCGPELAVAAAPDARADFVALRRNGTRLPLSICAGQLPAADRQAGNSAGRCNGWNGRCFSTIAGGRRGAKLEGGARSGLPGT